jgi:hypothetical protein
VNDFVILAGIAGSRITQVHEIVRVLN